MPRRSGFGLALALAAVPSILSGQSPSAVPQGMPALIPLPASVQWHAGDEFVVGAGTAILTPPGDADARRAAGLLATLIEHVTGRVPEVRDASAGAADPGAHIALTVSRPAAARAEQYELTVNASGIRLNGADPAGLFYAVQTLRQLLPPEAEYRGLRPRELRIPGVRIVDAPRFEWRGAMLDVARHFFTVAQVKRYIDQLALYKINRLHLHLTDDQGWRIEIRSWPELTRRGATTAVGGGPGGFYTQAEYAEIVGYARDRHIVVVPEIDVPGHTNAALVAYQSLNCGRPPRESYTGIEVGFIALCVDDPVTGRFIDDVVRELASMTPGPWFHMGGDEVKTLTPEQYARFMKQVEATVERHGKTLIGWGEIHKAGPSPRAIVQHWIPNEPPALAPGAKVILSPADRVYLDMKYHAGTPIGLHWAGYVDVRRAYDWDPVTLIPGVAEDAVLGIEAPLWTETIVTSDDLEYMAFPRLPGVAELAWSPAANRSWEEYRTRLARHAPRWAALGINAWWSPEVEWAR